MTNAETQVRLEIEMVQRFIDQLQRHAVRKAKTNDGANRDFSIDTALRFLVEEVGEVATAITRERLGLARDECFDIAHCALLLWMSLCRLEAGK